MALRRLYDDHRKPVSVIDGIRQVCGRVKEFEKGVREVDRKLSKPAKKIAVKLAMRKLGI